jgi:predicted Zn-dependent peptidase
MRLTRVFIVLLGLVALSACGGSRTPSHGPDGALTINIALPIEELDLPNGLHVVLHQERSSSLALVHVRYHVGSKDDPQGRSGFAHLFEHLMFRGSRNTGTKDYQQWLEDVGGITNAETNLDTTDYHAYVPPGALPRAIWLEADRMAYPLAPLDAAGFAHERDVVKNEWREHYEDVPLGNLDSIAREAIYGISHPYGTSTIGRADELDKATLEEARAFARAYYRPNNATLVVCGQFDLPATRELVKRYFGTIPAGPPMQARSMPPPQPVRTQRIAVAAAVDGPAVMVAWPAPATHGDGMEELGYGFGFFSGHLRRRLVVEKKMANAVETHYEHARLGGIAKVVVKLKPGESPDTALSVIDEYLGQAARLGRQWSFDRLPDYKTRALVNEVGTMEGLEGRARRILHDIEMHGAANSMQQDLKRLQAVDAADVGAAVEHFLIDGPRVTVVVKPDASAPRAGKKVAR